LDDYDEVEYPDFDDPPNRLHFNELHPLIQKAARPAWEQKNYSQAIRDAWIALRDEIRTRSGKLNLDGLELINEGVGETNPRLPLTDFVTETERNMHRGLVNFLRGIVFYIRHPEAHESESPVKEDREGAFERLAVMSLCARHVTTAAPPTAIEDAIHELQQPRFPRKPQAFDDLLRRIPLRRRAELAEAVMAAAKEASESQSPTFETLAAMYRHTLQKPGDESLSGGAAAQLGRLVADDDTFEFAVYLMTPSTARKLEERHALKVHDYIVEQFRTRRMGDLGKLFPLLTWIVFSLSAGSRSEVVDAIEEALLDEDVTRSFFGFLVLSRLSEQLSDEERARLVGIVANRLVEDPKSQNSGLIRLRMDHISTKLRGEIDNAVTELEPSVAAADDDIPF
jgi:uncharacterized protein (TIGR02391 family)